MIVVEQKKCHICGCDVDSIEENPTKVQTYNVCCKRCGYFSIDNYYVGEIKEENKSLVSHLLAKISSENKENYTDALAIHDSITKNNLLPPKPAETADNLIMFLGKSLGSSGVFYDVSGEFLKLGGILGLTIGKEREELSFIIDELLDQKLLRKQNSGANKPDIQNISLTMSGWQRYEELKRAGDKNSRKAFLAMKFYDKYDNETDYYFQNTLFPDYLIKAVKDTDYNLENPLLDPKAGNIHARIEVEIRNSRFVIAELSHHNNGAYWEAGFARGLGKPVIYMYNKEISEIEKPHFDVGSDHIVFWTRNDPEDAAQRLKACIRSTLIGEAKMSD